LIVLLGESIMSETTRKPGEQPHPLEESYQRIAKKAEEQNPGINDLLALYGELQAGLSKSQEYLELFHKTYVTSASNSSTH
jgi:hypothetical protein